MESAISRIISLLVHHIVPPGNRAAKLDIRFRKHFCQNSPVEIYGIQPSTKPGYWIRIQVKNKGRENAEKVVGVVTQIADSEFNRRPQIKPIALHWSRNEVLDCLRPGEFAYLDLLVAYRDSKKRVFWLRATDDNLPTDEKKLVLPTPTDEHEIDRVGYYLKIEVYAQNAKSAQRFLYISWIGNDLADIQVRKLRIYERILLGLKNLIA